MNDICFVCEGEPEGMFSLEVYEDLIVSGSGGYQSVCKRCFYLVCGYVAHHAGAIPVHEIRSLIKEAPEALFLVSVLRDLQESRSSELTRTKQIERLLCGRVA